MLYRFVALPANPHALAPMGHYADNANLNEDQFVSPPGTPPKTPEGTPPAKRKSYDFTPKTPCSKKRADSDVADASPFSGFNPKSIIFIGSGSICDVYQDSHSGHAIKVIKSGMQLRSYVIGAFKEHEALNQMDLSPPQIINTEEDAIENMRFICTFVAPESHLAFVFPDPKDQTRIVSDLFCHTLRKWQEPGVRCYTPDLHPDNIYQVEAGKWGVMDFCSAEMDYTISIMLRTLNNSRNVKFTADDLVKISEAAFTAQTSLESQAKSAERGINVIKIRQCNDLIEGCKDLIASLKTKK
jgi:hypothetical protein